MNRHTRLVSTAGLALGIALAAVPSLAQSRGQTPAPSSRSDTWRFDDLERRVPVILTGTVLLEEGVPSPESVVIVRSCGGGPPVAEAYTDDKGHFSFELGRSTTALSGAQESMPAGGHSTDLMGCELRARLTGFTSDVVDLSARRALDSPEVGTIYLHRLEGVVGSTFSLSTMRASRDAKKAFEKGHELAGKEKLDEARKQYEKALRLFPDFAAAWFELGLVHEMRQRPEDARAAYREAVAADPEYIKPYRQLAVLAFNEQSWDEVAEATGRIIALDPVSYPGAFYYNAAASFFVGKLEAAERSAREAIELGAQGTFPEVHYVLGVILLEKRDYASAAENLREYVEIAAASPDVDRAKMLLERLEASGVSR